MEHVYVFAASMALMFICAGIAKWRAKKNVEKEDFTYVVRPKQ